MAELWHTIIHWIAYAHLAAYGGALAWVLFNQHGPLFTIGRVQRRQAKGPRPHVRGWSGIELERLVREDSRN